MRRQAQRQSFAASPEIRNRTLACGDGGALGGTRTPNLLIRSQMLYPLSYERRCPDSLRHRMHPLRSADITGSGGCQPDSSRLRSMIVPACRPVWFATSWSSR